MSIFEKLLADIERGQAICAALNSKVVGMSSTAFGFETVNCYSGDRYNIWDNRANEVLKGK